MKIYKVPEVEGVPSSEEIGMTTPLSKELHIITAGAGGKKSSVLARLLMDHDKLVKGHKKVLIIENDYESIKDRIAYIQNLYPESYGTFNMSNIEFSDIDEFMFEYGRTDELRKPIPYGLIVIDIAPSLAVKDMSILSKVSYIDNIPILVSYQLPRDNKTLQRVMEKLMSIEG